MKATKEGIGKIFEEYYPEHPLESNQFNEFADALMQLNEKEVKPDEFKECLVFNAGKTSVMNGYEYVRIIDSDGSSMGFHKTQLPKLIELLNSMK